MLGAVLISESCPWEDNQAPASPMANITTEDSPLLFRERPDWADLTPLEQYENLTPIAPILYSEECKQRIFPFYSKFHFCNAECFIKTKMPPITFEESLK
jgi:hypothetical protein